MFNWFQESINISSKSRRTRILWIRCHVNSNEDIQKDRTFHMLMIQKMWSWGSSTLTFPIKTGGDGGVPKEVLSSLVTAFESFSWIIQLNGFGSKNMKDNGLRIGWHFWKSMVWQKGMTMGSYTFPKKNFGISLQYWQITNSNPNILYYIIT